MQLHGLLAGSSSSPISFYGEFRRRARVSCRALWCRDFTRSLGGFSGQFICEELMQSFLQEFRRKNGRNAGKVGLLRQNLDFSVQEASSWINCRYLGRL